AATRRAGAGQRGASSSWTSVARHATRVARSRAEMAMPERAIGAERLRAAAPRDASLLDDDVVVADRDQPFDVLVDHDHREAGAAQRRERAPDLLAHEGREPFGRLVEDQQQRIGDEGTADREHLLLAARELVAEVVAAAGEGGEHREDARRRPRGRAFDAGTMERAQVLLDAEVREHLSSFGDERDPAASDPVRREPGDGAAGERDRPCARPHEAHHRAHERRLAHAVPAEDADDLAARDREVDAEQHLARTVAGMDASDVEKQCGRGHVASSPRYAARTAASLRTAAGVPVAMTRPET